MVGRGLGDGGLPGKKIALDLQLPDLAVQIVDDLLRIFHRCLAAARKQLARPPHQFLFPVADHRRMNPKLRRQLRQVFSPDSDAIATRALNSALCCFLFTPTSHVLWTDQPLAYPAVQKSGAAADERFTNAGKLLETRRNNYRDLVLFGQR